MISDPLLENIAEDGTVPTRRVKDPEAAKMIFDRLYEADRERRQNRSEVQAMFDGTPPYDEAELVATGQSDRANINFGEGEELLEKSMGSYVDLLTSVETLISVKMSFGDPSIRYQWEQIFAEEFTRMLRAWPRYTSNFLLLAHYFIGQGVGIKYHEDDVDWRWRVTSLGDFLIPNRTFACEEEIEVAVARRSYQVHQLYAFIRNEESASDAGWNVAEVKKAILGATNVGRTTYNDWEQLQTDLKNNDLTLGYASGQEVRVLHLWAKEFDGSVSHMITLETADNEDFLCYTPSKFKTASQAYTVFTYGIGTNGYYHSIRGLGYKVFPHVQASNRLRGQFFDGAMLSSSLLIQPENEEALQDLTLFYYGPFAVIPPKSKIIERAIPNFGTNVQPMLTDLSKMIQSRTGSYQPSHNPQGVREKTKFEVQVESAQGDRLSASSLNLFYEPWQRHLREVVRRVIRKNYLPTEPGGEEVKKFIDRCVGRGVPAEAIYNIDLERVTAMRAVGAGSEAARIGAFEEFLQLMPSFDDAGRQNVLRDRVAARVGYDQVDRYIQPLDADARPLKDQKIADLENNFMKLGQEIEVLPNENHLVHARTHATLIKSYLDALNAGQAQLTDVVQQLALVVNHQADHVQRLGQDQSSMAESAELRQQLQAAGEFTFNGMEELKKQQEQAQSQHGQMQQQAGQPGQSPEETDKQQRAIAETQAKIELMKKIFSVKQYLQIAAFRQKQSIADAQAARQMQRDQNYGL